MFFSDGLWYYCTMEQTPLAVSRAENDSVRSDANEAVAERLRQLGYLNCVDEIYQLNDEGGMEEGYLPLKSGIHRGLTIFPLSI